MGETRVMNDVRSEEDAIENEATSRAAFGAMVYASVLGALISAAAALVLKLALAAFGPSPFLLRVAPAALEAIGLGCVVFLSGFAGAIVIGIPLQRFMEKSGRERAAPFYFAALAVNIVVYSALAWNGPGLSSASNWIHLAPSLVISFLATHRLRRIWAARRTADIASIVPLHLH